MIAARRQQGKGGLDAGLSKLATYGRFAKGSASLKAGA